MDEPNNDSLLETWMIRAGRHAVYADAFVSGGCVSIGFVCNRLGAAALTMSREELVECTRRERPDWSIHKVSSQAGQVARFITELRIGDRVATYDHERRLYFVGEVKSGALFDPGRTENQPFVREVAWDSRVQRDSLSIDARNSLGSIMTLFKVKGVAAEELQDRAVAIDAPEVETPVDTSRTGGQQGDVSLDDLRDEVREKASEFVEDMIASLDWDELQQLVAGILRAMGYKTRVSAPGPDRGVDVAASPDGLGLEAPRIFVEVKHRRNTAMGAPEIRSFLGGRKSGDRCLYVSTGGFTREARYEAERSEVPLTLLSLGQLQELVVEHYDAMDIEARSLVPLTKVYWPVAEG